VRELRNVIERASILSDTSEIASESIHFNTKPLCCGQQCHPVPQTVCERPLKEQVGDYERNIVLDTLNSTSSVRQAARKLALSHTALLKKIQKYRLSQKKTASFWEPAQP